MLRKSRSDDRGFTLIEALVALAIVAAVLSSIGAVIATTTRGSRGIDQRLALAGAAETLMATLPGRLLLKSGSQSGELADQRWRIDVSPMTPADDDPQAGRWMPVVVTMRLQGPGGASVQATTVRLVPRAGQ
ncbi:prepilin-type N-terminal cleavage/methylation domain-containing protein [Bradyrhizobium prioriisuperbiae]|uniref:prepilin-type N-terminal cleavage/methylation domain-containing protein n=1 Tax=Bradyrhizobium prioriisuperbiae TaxID=2854389 RepID=UPI0028E66A4A|nr:prepilin-type N-terminal cleavage/methylation domain-containing protein [Bradyrhizobium prioritasuperba]